jgi:hypothetical protein
MRRTVIHSQHLSITLRYSATGNNFEDLKFIMVQSELIRIIVLEKCLLIGRLAATGEQCARVSMEYSTYCANLKFYNQP